MNRNHAEKKVHQLNALPKKLIQLFSRAIAKLILKFNVNRHEYIQCLDEQLIHEAKRQDPKATKVQLAVRTGIDRRFIASYLKGSPPTLKPNKLTLILSDIKWTLNKYYPPGCTRIPKSGPFRTFQSICEQWVSGTLTHNAVLNELVRIGSVVDHGNEVELIDSDHVDVKEMVKYFEMSSNLLNRFSNTITANLEIPEKADQNYQMSAISTQIPPENIEAVKAEIKSELRIYFNNIIEILEKHEKNVKPDTYPAYGVTLLEFNDETPK